MKYVHAPNEISHHTIRDNKFCLAPSKYSYFYPDSNVEYRTLNSLADLSEKRVKVKKKEVYKYIEIGDINVNYGYIDGKKYFGHFVPSSSPKLVKTDDILVSTVRTYRKGIGIVDSLENNLICSPAILVIREIMNTDITKDYLLAILRSDFFSEQILSLQNRGMYPRLDKDSSDYIMIPIPSDNGILQYVSLLMRAIINKQREIRKKNSAILNLVNSELTNNQKNHSFAYEHPTLTKLQNNGRIDAGFYSKDYEALIFRIKNYSNDFSPLDKQGLKLIPGPSLELKLLGTRIDSAVPAEGFYRLITPKQISILGTIDYFDYIGTPKEIATLEYGDILFGESGTGRSIVYLENDKNTINNAHAHILRPEECSLERAIAIRAILAYYKEVGLIDHLTVGGSGGHLSPSYFDRVLIPNFPESKQIEISKLYHNPNAKIEIAKLTLDNFVERDIAYNQEAGISELDKSSKILNDRIEKIVHRIIMNEKIEIGFDFLSR